MRNVETPEESALNPTAKDCETDNTVNSATSGVI